MNVLSRLNPSEEPRMGDIRIGESKCHILTIDGNSGWPDLEPFPLPGEIPTSGEIPLTFREWSILREFGNDEVELWRRSDATE